MAMVVQKSKKLNGHQCNIVFRKKPFFSALARALLILMRWTKMGA